MSFLRELGTFRCRKCGARAGFELINFRNASMGHYCARCGRAAKRELDREEAAYDLQHPPTGPRP